jgi:hypothetical protein
MRYNVAMAGSAFLKRVCRFARRARGAHSCTLVFVHIPKTAGISLREVLLERYDEARRFRILHPADDLAKLAALTQEQRGRLDLIEGHMYYGVHQLIGRECRYMTMLRDPVERVLSCYSYVRENDWHHLYDRIARGGMSLADCLRDSVSIELDNHMVRTLAGQQYIHLPFGHVAPAMLEEAKSNLSTFAAVGLCEEFDQSLALFARTFGWRGAKPRLSNATRGRVRREELDDQTVALVESHNALDRELYAHARSLFARRCADAGV